MSRSGSGKGGERIAQMTMRSRLNALIGERRRTVVALSLTSIVSAFTEAALLSVVAQIATSLVSGAKHIPLNAGPLHTNFTTGSLLAIAFGLAAIRLSLQVPVSVLPARISSTVQATLRRRMFDAFTRASWAMQSSEREGHLQEIMTSQVLQATQGAMQATSLMTSLFTFIILLGSALALNVVAALIVAGSAILMFACLRPLNQLGARSARSLSQAQMQYAGGIGEASRLAEETQVFGVGAARRSLIDGLIGNAQGFFFRTQLFGRLAPNIYQSMVLIVLLVGLAAIYNVGAHHVASLGAVVLLLLRAGTYGQAVQATWQSLRQSLPFIERLQEAERRYRESSPVVGHTPLTGIQTLAFENVSFSYQPGRPVLSDIEFQIDRGETVGIIGPSGAGKSTLVQILLQLRAPESGRYLINGVSAEQFERDDWHKQVAYVSQEPRLIHASVTDNIRYFRPLDDEAVQRAAQLAHIHDDIIGWSKGYDTIVGPRADAVSGGQQQRICLARALAARPEVLVLDEPTSALDPHSETLIQESLTALKDELTLFIVAHRMSTLDICRRVMVVIDGRLVAFDTTELLGRRNSYYRSASGIGAGALGDGLL
jgi:ATP-binding cassette, subfamily B, bacterial